MKNVNSLVATFLILQVGVSSANDAPFIFLDENKVITQLNSETDSSKKQQLINSLTNMCPFKEETTQLSGLITLNNAADATSKNLNPNDPECQALAKNINDGIQAANTATTIAGKAEMNMNGESQKKITDNLTIAVSTGSALQAFMQSKCNAENSNTVLTRANTLFSNAERASMLLAPITPIPAIAASLFSSVGRIVVGTKGWLSRKPKSNTPARIMDSQKYISDLCSFRNLTYQYDGIVTEISNLSNEKVAIKKDPLAEQRLIDKKTILANELSGLGDMVTCTQAVRQSTDSLTNFSLELAPFLDKEASQKVCINTLTKYVDSKSSTEISPIDTLAKRYNCSLIEAEGTQTDRKNISFCKNYQSIEEMSSGDIYEKCEDEKFQKTISAKFISLTDIILRNIQGDLQAIAPAVTKIQQLQNASSSIDDELQNLREIEQNEKVVGENQLGLQAVMEMSRTTNLNTSRSITNIGRNILGERFDLFAKSSLDSAAAEIKDASAGLKDLISENNKLDGRRFLSKKLTEQQKTEAKKEICRSAQQVKKQFIDGYKAGAGVKDICDFTKGDGIPPLVSPGENFDSYSASVNNRENNITNKCKKITTTVTSNNNIIRQQMSSIAGLGCEI